MTGSSCRQSTAAALLLRCRSCSAVIAVAECRLFERVTGRLLFIDEQSNIQLLLFGQLAKDTTDILPGHIWVDKSFFQARHITHQP